MSIMKGFTAIQEASKEGLQQLKLKDGESAVIRILSRPEEIISVYEYTIQVNGRWTTVTALDRDNDPLYAAGHRPSFKSYVVVLNKTEDKVQVFKASKTVGRQLIGLMEEYGNINNRDFKISRSGEKLSTTYQFFPRDKEEMDFSKYEDQIPNIEEMVAPKTREALLAMLNGMDGATENKQESKQETKKDDFPF